MFLMVVHCVCCSVKGSPSFSLPHPLLPLRQRQQKPQQGEDMLGKTVSNPSCDTPPTITLHQIPRKSYQNIDRLWLTCCNLWLEMQVYKKKCDSVDRLFICGTAYCEIAQPRWFSSGNEVWRGALKCLCFQCLCSYSPLRQSNSLQLLHTRQPKRSRLGWEETEV